MICTVLAVPPLTVRPSVVMDDNQRMEDDLTHKLIDVLRNNQRLRDKLDKGESAEMIDKYTAMASAFEGFVAVQYWGPSTKFLQTFIIASFNFARHVRSTTSCHKCHAK
jgi:hypothetical protein